MQGLMKFHQRLLKISKKQNVTNGRTDVWMDGQRENSIPTHKHSLGGGGEGGGGGEMVGTPIFG